jgi:hypothetical protein
LDGPLGDQKSTSLLPATNNDDAPPPSPRDTRPWRERLAGHAAAFFSQQTSGEL